MMFLRGEEQSRVGLRQTCGRQVETNTDPPAGSAQHNRQQLAEVCPVFVDAAEHQPVFAS